MWQIVMKVILARHSEKSQETQVTDNMLMMTQWLIDWKDP